MFLTSMLVGEQGITNGKYMLFEGMSSRPCADSSMASTSRYFLTLSAFHGNGQPSRPFLVSSFVYTITLLTYIELVKIFSRGSEL